MNKKLPFWNIKKYIYIIKKYLFLNIQIYDIAFLGFVEYFFSLLKIDPKLKNSRKK